jgi:hypothetical protein
MGCLFGAEFNMLAVVKRYEGSPDTTVDGEWQIVIDPISGAPVRKWVTVDTDPGAGVALLEVPCAVRGVMNGGINAAGDTQRFSEIYQNIGWARMSFPSSFHLSNRDQVTNIRNADGDIVFRNEEAETYNETLDEWIAEPTVFNVMGVTASIDPFGRVTKNIALLQRAEVQ